MLKVSLFFGAVSFVLSAVFTGLLLPILRRLKMGQSILQIGPAWHVSKQGTPTAGGIAFLAVAIVCTFIGTLFFRVSITVLAVMLFALLCGIIGLADDLIKIVRKQNEGLSASAKFLLQLIAATVFLVFLAAFDTVGEQLYIPFWGRNVYIGRLWYPFALLLLIGFTNAVNLTDGLDGLCSSVSGAVAIGGIALSVIAAEYTGAFVFSVILGCCGGFLIYNFHPARVFMGDTGSLFLGAAISGAFLVSSKSTAIIILGFVFLLEAISVIIQVLYYKATKKRLFLMAPFHHHLEKKGYGEVKITFLMLGATLLLCAVAVPFI